MTEGDALASELAPDLGVEWDVEAVREALDGSRRAWSLRGGLDAGRFESLRIVYGTAGEDVLVLAAARPVGASGHDADLVDALRVPASGPALRPDEVLLSVEHDAGGSLRRLGVELWLDEGSPLRVAADRAGETERAELDDGRCESTPIALRIAGQAGHGRHELIVPG